MESSKEWNGLDATDRLYSPAMGRKVYELAGGPKELAIINGAGHSDHYLFGSFDIINAWIDKLRTAVKPAKASAQ